ncbi:Cyclophilin-like peptidyl-prolyl cis-trans isomerase domain [Pseudocohnilembus persalinus]|uniref:Peptidyl-prolyl cis-trans isomerase n=1 Tax=Pseudocohnilembus persalinus TaxID=266149 RepID=A0A0V0QT59_PSEPJ|nr:Cyclophilin-like peptidyl-prolyl cis-trans isomerase domain [Pseudocohnilembus persalinus]|eukprot:KRX05396.1 Cyclophilin-like peptidyl-prolyl cis-trans isomerase domain [Pseudocohnilembus persalinus]
MSLTLQTTHGDLKVELFCELCPTAAKNFLALSAKGYYDDTIFHRNIKGFIVQGGDPTGTGKGGQSVFGKQFKDEIHADVKCDKRGLLCMANSGKNTNGSQFFFTYGKAPHLNGQYTIFGKVIDGFDALDKMEQEPVDQRYKPLNEIKINSIKIHANPIADQEA